MAVAAGVIAVGLVMVVVGALLPWVVVERAGGGRQAFSGLQGSGVLTLGAGLFAMVSGLWAWRTSTSTSTSTSTGMGMVLSLLALGVCGYEWRAARTLAIGPWGDVWRFGPGYWLTAIGALAAALGFAVVFGAARVRRR